MRTIHIASLALSLAAGCAASSAVSASHGETARAYAGGIALVFTNATPDKMCGLYMSADDLLDYGDNWLPRGGLASGGSLELRVRPGTYKAKWETCPKHGVPTYAGTLWHELAFTVDHETQLYAYVADTVAPTKRAAVLDRDHVKVMAQGQPVPRPGQAIAVAAPAPKAAPAPVAKAKFDDVIDRPSAKRVATKKSAMRPSFRR